MIRNANQIAIGEKVWGWGIGGMNPVEIEWDYCYKNIVPSTDVFADTREELLIHMIFRQQARIADAEVEISRLQGMREVKG